jgi:hypothetical protein
VQAGLEARVTPGCTPGRAGKPPFFVLCSKVLTGVAPRHDGSAARVSLWCTPGRAGKPPGCLLCFRVLSRVTLGQARAAAEVTPGCTPSREGKPPGFVLYSRVLAGATPSQAGVVVGATWYVSNVSIIFDAPCLFLHYLLSISLHSVPFLCMFRN